MTNIAKKPVAAVRTLVTRSSPRTEMQRWFIKRGLPHFIEPYSAGPDVWSRAAPVLVVAYIAGGLHGLDLAHWSLKRNVVGAGVVLAILLATWMTTNVVRHRPLLSRPHELGSVELAAFLIGPALPALAFAQWGDAVAGRRNAARAGIRPVVGAVLPARQRVRLVAGAGGDSRD